VGSLTMPIRRMVWVRLIFYTILYAPFNSFIFRV
jgi:hypothetical protein